MPGHRPITAGLRRHRRSGRRRLLDERVRQVGRRTARRVGHQRARRAGRPLVRRRRGHQARSRHAVARALAGAGELHRRFGVAQRARIAQCRRTTVVGLGAALPGRRVARAAGNARASGGVRRPAPQLGAQPSGDRQGRQPGEARRPARRARTAPRSRHRDHDPVGVARRHHPRESFEALCVASGVEGTIIDGSHSWLLADPQQFGEVITNDVRVAQAARDLERSLDHTKQRGLRRVPTLRRRASADRPPARRRDAE